MTAVPERLWWSALVLATTYEVMMSILHGRPVLVRQLDRVVLRRALRGGLPPEPDNYLLVTVEMLAAVNEAGPLVLREGRFRENRVWPPSRYQEAA